MKFLRLILLPLCVGTPGAGAAGAATPAPPNLIVILTDDQGLGKVGSRSGIIGKWHFGAHPDLYPLGRSARVAGVPRSGLAGQPQEG